MEFFRLSGAEERRQALSAGIVAFLKTPTLWIMFFGILVATAAYQQLLEPAVFKLARDLTGAHVSVWIVYSVVHIALPVTWILIPVYVLFRRFIRCFAREYLVAHGLLVCIRCGYDLFGHTDDNRCPECGAGFALTPNAGARQSK